MRLATVLIAVSALGGPCLADIQTVRRSLFDVMAKVKTLDQAVSSWPGGVVSGGDVVCRTVELRKSLRDCARTFDASAPLRNQDLSRSSPLPLVRLAAALLDLKDHAVAAKPKFDALGATPAIAEVLRAQREPASELSTSMAGMLDRLPPAIRDAQLPLPSGRVKAVDFARAFVSQEIDDAIRQFDPDADQASPLKPLVLIAVRFSDSIDVGPFCRALPPLVTLLGAQRSVGLGALTDKVLPVLESSGVQDQVPLDIMRATAEAFGVPADTIPRLLARFGVQAQGVPLRTFTQHVPGIIRALNLQDLDVDPSKMAKFVDLFVKNTVAGDGGARRKGRTRKRPARPA